MAPQSEHLDRQKDCEAVKARPTPFDELCARIFNALFPATTAVIATGTRTLQREKNSEAGDKLREELADLLRERVMMYNFLAKWHPDVTLFGDAESDAEM